MSPVAEMKISSVMVRVPVDLSRIGRRKMRDHDRIEMEILAAGCRIWNVAGGLPGEYYSFTRTTAESPSLSPGRDSLLDVPFFEDVYAYLLTQAAANRGNPLGAFLAGPIEAMETAIADRDGACVYFAGAGDRIKIGWSRRVSARLSELQTGNPHPVRLLATTPGARSHERQLHQRFAHLRVVGEWFQAAPDLLAHIAALGGGAR